jgi:aconitate hydratase
MLAENFAKGRDITVRLTPGGSPPREIRARVRIDTPQEILYYQHGGILQYVLRQLSASQ